MKRTLLALAASAAVALATTVAPASASLPADVTKSSCLNNKTLRAACVQIRWDGETRKVTGNGSTLSFGDPKLGAVTELVVQRRTCGGSWRTSFYDADTDGYAVFDFVGSAPVTSPIRGQQWRAKAVLSWKVDGYPSTRQSTVRTTPAIGTC